MRHVRRSLSAQVRTNMERHGVDVVRGSARLTSPGTVAVTTPDGDMREISARAVLIATGSRPFHPPDLPLDDPDVHDSETILAVDSPFKSAVVIGSGAVGSEYATIMAALGVHVTLLEAGPRVLGIADAEMSAELARCMAVAGIDVRTATTAQSITREDGRLTVRLSDGETLSPSKVLFAVGRTANSDGLGLEDLGVDLDPRRSIVVDEVFRTSVAGVFAAGDVVGPPGLASVSVEQGRVAASAACGTAYAQSQRYVPRAACTRCRRWPGWGSPRSRRASGESRTRWAARGSPPTPAPTSVASPRGR